MIHGPEDAESLITGLIESFAPGAEFEYEADGTTAGTQLDLVPPIVILLVCLHADISRIGIGIQVAVRSTTLDETLILVYRACVSTSDVVG